MQPIEPTRLARIKTAFSTRRVATSDIAMLDEQADNLRPGDLVVARIDEIGHHSRIERPDGRKALMYTGDEVLIACGARYAPDQFEADCPTGVGPANLAAAGGVAGIVQLSHQRMAAATELTILGAACDESGRRLNLSDYAVSHRLLPIGVPVIAVCGTSMNAGKTHTVASVVRGYALAGWKVAAIKVTGTGAGGDLWSFTDAGATHVRDFTDAGFATTYRMPVDAIVDGARRLVAEAQSKGMEIVVVEIADGLHQGETAALLRHDAFRSMLVGMIFAAADGMGAVAGARWLREHDLPVRAISGVLTCSPLAMREAEAAVDLPCLLPEELMDRTVVSWLVDTAPMAASAI